MKKKTSISTWLLSIIFIAGLSLLLYPTVSNYWNSRHTTRAIVNYADTVARFSPEDYDAFMAAAVDYNRGILTRENTYLRTDEEKEIYRNVLNIDGSGVMGYIEIPAIDVNLPVYHGTEERVLQVAIGHIDWSALPVGGESTHCVLSGHRGLPSAKLFTNLDKLVVGDVFMLHVLDEVLTYEVDRILIVEPQDTEPLQTVVGKDYCTLVTCTPYGINTHRLLVRGHRIETAAQAVTVHITADALQVEPLIVATVMGIPALMLIMIFVFIFGGKRNKASRKEEGL